MTRHPGTLAARALANARAELAVADMEDPASLDGAFTGAYGVYSVQNFTTSGPDGEVRQGATSGTPPTGRESTTSSTAPRAQGNVAWGLAPSSRSWTSTTTLPSSACR
jgi:hypothetical protein